MNYITLATATADSSEAPPAASPFGGMMTMLLIFFAIFYFMMIRPQQRKEKERKKQIEQLRAGVKVSFAGGLIGTIHEVKEHTFLVKVADNTIIEIARGAINGIISDPNAPAAPATK